MVRRASSFSGSLLALILGGAIAVACSNSKDGTTFGKDAAQDGGSSGGSSGGLFSEAGTTMPDGGCASESVKAEQEPLDIYIMLDQSVSMEDMVQGGGSKWTAVTDALNAFVKQPSAAGIGVGLQYFGLPADGQRCPSVCQTPADCAGLGDCVSNHCSECPRASSCNTADYATPELEIAPLDATVADAIAASLRAHGPSNQTPTYPALKGAVDHAAAWAQTHPGHITIVVFATDGEPGSDCKPDNLDDIKAVAAAAAAGSPKILTFVVGVGSTLTNLNGIAAAGGTSQALLVDTGGNVNQQFLDAMNKIRGAALGCEYHLPIPKGNAMLDYGAVNVVYTSNGGNPETLPKVADKAHCPPSDDAWYYDNDTKPTQILLCDSSCTKVSGDAAAQVGIVVGCATVVK